MKLFRFILRRNPARELARVGAEKRRRTVNQVARQIRRELGLPHDPRLA